MLDGRPLSVALDRSLAPWAPEIKYTVRFGTVIRKVLGDLTSAGVDCDEERVREVLRNKEIDARRQIIEASNL